MTALGVFFVFLRLFFVSKMKVQISANQGLKPSKAFFSLKIQKTFLMRMYIYTHVHIYTLSSCGRTGIGVYKSFMIFLRKKADSSLTT